MSLSIPTSENMAAVTFSIFTAAAITGEEEKSRRLLLNIYITDVA